MFSFLRGPKRSGSRGSGGADYPATRIRGFSHSGASPSEGVSGHIRGRSSSTHHGDMDRTPPGLPRAKSLSAMSTEEGGSSGHGIIGSVSYQGGRSVQDFRVANYSGSCGPEGGIDPIRIPTEGRMFPATVLSANGQLWISFDDLKREGAASAPARAHPLSPGLRSSPAPEERTPSQVPAAHANVWRHRADSPVALDGDESDESDDSGDEGGDSDLTGPKRSSVGASSVDSGGKKDVRRKTRGRSFKPPHSGPRSNVQRLLALPEQISSFSRKLVNNVWFDRLLLLVIAVNCVFLALDVPAASEKEKELYRTADIVFVSIYTAEMLLKMMAFGLVRNARGYFRTMWNWLDFAVVMEGLISIIWLDGESNLAVLRGIRALRPLRSVKYITGLKLITSALIRSVPMLLSTLVVVGFYLLVFGIVGVELFKGVLKKQCVDSSGVVPLDLQGRTCGGSFSCPSGLTCKKLEDNVNGDNLNFDSFPQALNAIFQCITLEGWSPFMYLLQDSSHSIAWLYFIALILFGAFILINLLLAVVMAKFRQASEEVVEQRRERDKVRLEREAARAAHLQKLKLAASMSFRRSISSRAFLGGSVEEVENPLSIASRRALQRRPTFVVYDPVEARSRDMSVVPGVQNESGVEGEEKEDAMYASQRFESSPGLRGGQPAERIGTRDGAVGAVGAQRNEDVKQGDGWQSRISMSCIGMAIEKVTCRLVCGRCGSAYDRNFARHLRSFISSKVISVLIYVSVSLNGIALAIEHDNMPEDLSDILRYINIGFVILFCLELLIKLLGYGLAGYMSDGFNIVDGVVAIVSVVEVLASRQSALSVFR